MARVDSSDAVFSPDASTIAFSNGNDGPPHVFTMAATGGEQTVITPMSTAEYVRDWSPDGRFIAYTEQWARSKGDIWLVAPQAKARPVAWAATPFTEADPRFSPDGKWLAYGSDESGHEEVYVARFDKPSERVQISIGGGYSPSWRRDGKELYFINDNKLWAVSIQTSPSLDAGKPQVLFSDNGASWDGFDAMPDGQRFLVTRVLSGPTTRPLNVIVNWQQLLEKR
jgi:Tol biopolymer transport system component